MGFKPWYLPLQGSASPLGHHDLYDTQIVYDFRVLDGIRTRVSAFAERCLILSATRTYNAANYLKADMAANFEHPYASGPFLIGLPIRLPHSVHEPS